MKKTILGFCLATTCIAQAETPTQDVSQQVDTFYTAVNNVPFSFSDFPTQTKLGCVAGVTFSVLAGNICTYAFLKAFGEKRELKTFHPSEWGTAVTIGTGVGLGLGISGVYASQYPAGILNAIDRSLLTLVVAHGDNPEKLIQELDVYFIAQRFPKVCAFTSLSRMSSQLTSIQNLFDNLKCDTKTRRQNQAIKAHIKMLINNINQTILTLKQDSKWLSECSAETFEQAQQNMQAHNNAQLAGAVIQLANSR